MVPICVASTRTPHLPLPHDTLRETGGNQTKAAELLGLPRTHLVKLLRALKIREPRDRGEAGG